MHPMISRAFLAWLGSNRWGEASHEATANVLTTMTDDEIIERWFQAGGASRAEVQVVLDEAREDNRLRSIWGAVEMERRRRATG